MSPYQTFGFKATHSTRKIWWATFLYFRYSVFLSNGCRLRIDCVKCPNLWRKEEILILFPNQNWNNHMLSGQQWSISTVHRTNLPSAFLWYRYEWCIFSFISGDNISTSFGILLLCQLTKYSMWPLLFSGSSVLYSYLLAIHFKSDGIQHRQLRICCI